MPGRSRSLQNLESDGRPIFKIPARELFEIVSRRGSIVAKLSRLTFSHLGTACSAQNLDSILLTDCFGDMSPEKFPPWKPGYRAILRCIGRCRIRANVPSYRFRTPIPLRRLGREATVLEVEEMSYDGVIRIITRKRDVVETYEFHPEHGKYHHDGHRKCGVRMHPVRVRRGRWFLSEFVSRPDDIWVCSTGQKPFLLETLSRPSRAMTVAILSSNRATCTVPPFGAACGDFGVHVSCRKAKQAR